MNTSCLLRCIKDSLPWYLVWSALAILGIIVALSGGTVIILGVVVSGIVAVLGISGAWAAGVAVLIVSCYKKKCK